MKVLITILDQRGENYLDALFDSAYLQKSTGEKIKVEFHKAFGVHQFNVTQSGYYKLFVSHKSSLKEITEWHGILGEGRYIRVDETLTVPVELAPVNNNPIIEEVDELDLLI